ncbi:uncharacterized protein [Lolium perenne]|uniref:uncharacterized protein isoform X2 n=1 Tax=Lolium perenne TaxID=4522 RepID=UPI0021F52DBB|nr:uncharacterized protein LOC127345079 isoform X3 [Lolium perenne]XP_051227454.1 uncharacterized protein LOC127345079 isoform X4 [Lolium perenne]
MAEKPEATPHPARPASEWVVAVGRPHPARPASEGDGTSRDGHWAEPRRTPPAALTTMGGAELAAFSVQWGRGRRFGSAGGMCAAGEMAEVCELVLTNSLIGSVLSYNFRGLFCCLTNSMVATLDMSLTIPPAMVAHMVIHG